MSNSISSPVTAAAESIGAATARVRMGDPGTATQEKSRSLRAYAVAGKASESGARRSLMARTESIIGTDERVRILDTDLAPWRMICALRIHGAAGKAIGTGWLAGPSTVITAGHCVFHADLGGSGWARQIEVIPGLNGAERPRFGPITGGEPIISQLFSAHTRWASSSAGPDADFDIGCIHLSKPIGDETGWFGFAALPTDELSDSWVNVAGYPADRGAGRELFHNANRITELSGRRVHYEIDAYGGQSGSPVWVHETAGAPPVAVGIHAYGVSGANRVNSAPRIDGEIFDLLSKWIDEGHAAAAKVS